MFKNQHYTLFNNKKFVKKGEQNVSSNIRRRHSSYVSSIIIVKIIMSLNQF